MSPEESPRSSRYMTLANLRIILETWNPTLPLGSHIDDAISRVEGILFVGNLLKPPLTRTECRWLAYEHTVLRLLQAVVVYGYDAFASFLMIAWY
jgi:hypothetical protein